MAIRKNKKRIDPRYFLHETTYRNLNEEELLEENLKAFIAGAVMAFLTTAGDLNMSAGAIARTAETAVTQMQQNAGDATAQAYAIELLKGVADAEQNEKVAAGAVDFTAKKLPTVVSKMTPEIRASLGIKDKTRPESPRPFKESKTD
jgi:hypothetical protein|tara:strand:- start:299 stop:739 length:441 start_codon:yes stop_codon:yes gene_type:complete